jgi:hypothetical protein
MTAPISVQVSGGEIAVQGSAYGADQFGDFGIGLQGLTDGGTGVSAASQSGTAVQASSGTGVAVAASSEMQDAVQGVSAAPDHAGVSGSNSGSGPGVWAHSESGIGVYASSGSQDAVQGVSGSTQHAGVSGANTAPWDGEVPYAPGIWASSNATGIYARGNPAAYFQGDVQVTGDLILINSPASGDLAEDFDVDEDPADSEPGSVLVIAPTGRLCACADPYDTRVAGVVSGAGEFRPAVVLQRIANVRARAPVALIGKTYCKADGSFGSITAGDLLTTSPTRGHAMKVSDRSRALGAILGKALGPLESQRGLIPILVSLR